MSPKLAKYFERFVNNANKLGLHPLDWGRFYNFIAHSHSLRSRLSEYDLKCLLVERGFPEEYARELATIYDHGRTVIQVYKGSVPDGADDMWAAYERTNEQENDNG